MVRSRWLSQEASSNSIQIRTILLKLKSKRLTLEWLIMENDQQIGYPLTEKSFLRGLGTVGAEGICPGVNQLSRRALYTLGYCSASCSLSRPWATSSPKRFRILKKILPSWLVSWKSSIPSISTTKTSWA